MRFANWLHVAVAGGVLVGGALVAHADTFSVSGTLGSGATISGTVTADLANNKVLATNLSVSGDGLKGLAQDQSPGTYFGSYLGSMWEFAATYFPHGPSGVSSGLELLVSPSALAGASGAICSVSNPCPNFGSSYVEYGLGSYDYLQSGTIKPMAAAPEPGAMWLVGTGVLGGVGVLRRRFSR